MSKWLAEHVVPGKGSTWHIIHTPLPTEDDFYRQVVSIQCFRHRELIRRFGKDSITHKPNIEWTSVSWFDEHPKSSQQWLMETLEATPTEHASLWDFYKAIGYDYKKQRYTGAK